VSTSILDQVNEADAAQRTEQLSEYRSLLTLPDPKPADADRLREVARQLDFDLGRLQRDQEAVVEFVRLTKQAADQANAEADANAAIASAGKHKAAMEKKVAELQTRQAELDSTERAARNRLAQAESASRESKKLREANADLFAGLPDPEAEARRATLEQEAARLPELQKALDEGRTEAEEAEKAADQAQLALNRIPRGDPRKSAAVHNKVESVAKHNGLLARIHRLYEQIEKAKRAQRQLAKV